MQHLRRAVGCDSEAVLLLPAYSVCREAQHSEEVDSRRRTHGRKSHRYDGTAFLNGASFLLIIVPFSGSSSDKESILALSSALETSLSDLASSSPTGAGVIRVAETLSTVLCPDQGGNGDKDWGTRVGL